MEIISLARLGERIRQILARDEIQRQESSIKCTSFLQQQREAQNRSITAINARQHASRQALLFRARSQKSSVTDRSLVRVGELSTSLVQDDRRCKWDETYDTVLLYV